MNGFLTKISKRKRKKIDLNKLYKYRKHAFY
jgi:hypothetical protein